MPIGTSCRRQERKSDRALPSRTESSVEQILFTGRMLLVFRFFANVAIPGASYAALRD